jgi:predicted dehydrogenase
MRVAIVGCGFIGRKRAASLQGCTLAACADVDLPQAQALAGTSALATDDWRRAVSLPEVDLVIVATTHDALVPVTLAAIQAGKHVLVEKPAARNCQELAPVMAAAAENGVLVRVGFNHRYHPALRKAQELFRAGALGEMMFVRGRYGHGGRLGYDREWRADKVKAGGGELIDQGMHLIDLSRLFLGEFCQVKGLAHTYYWDMAVEDNGFMLLTTEAKTTAFLHVSWTEWKNCFSLEIYGKAAKLEINGLGGSYGVERLAYYRMLPELGPPETTIWEYPGPDKSWELEFAEFLEDIHLGRQPSAGLEDAFRAHQVIEAIYEESGL